MKTLCVIPARYASRRFPRKILADIHGKPMIERVYQQVSLAKKLDKIIIATDHQEVFQTLNEKNIPVMMSAEEHISGTDRCIEIFNKIGNYDLLLNVQGDEPGIDPEILDQLIDKFSMEADPQIATLHSEVKDLDSIQSPHNVKLVKSKDDSVLYFSRHAIPYARSQNLEFSYQKHIGVYLFHKDVVSIIKDLKPSTLEKMESLEQLRWMEYGLQIKAYPCQYKSRSIDTPDDLKAYLESM